MVQQFDKYVEKGLDVVVVGEKYGVKTVHLAQRVGEDGSVSVFDGNEKHTQRIRDTVERNDVNCEVTVTHAVIGEPIDPDVHDWVGIKDGEAGAASIPMSELPSADALILNPCGPELGLLADLESTPSIILTKAYDNVWPGFEAAATCLLNGSGYRISSRTQQEPGVSVLVGVLTDGEP